MKTHRTLRWTLAVLAVVAALVTGAVLLLMHQMLDRHIDYDGLFYNEDYDVEAEEHFVTTEDGLRIALYEVEAEAPTAVVLTLSGIEKPSGTAFLGHAEMFHRQGWSTVMIQMRAHGRSEGNRICLGYKETLDVGAALEYIEGKEEYEGLPVIIIGLSMGAGTAINAMAEYPQISALVSLSAFSSCEEAFVETLGESLPGPVASALKPFLHAASFLRYGRSSKLKPVKSITALDGRPALLLHTTEDSNVAYSNFIRLKAAAPANVETHSFEGDEHFITPDFFHPDLDERYSSILLGFISSVVGGAGSGAEL